MPAIATGLKLAIAVGVLVGSAACTTMPQRASVRIVSAVDSGSVNSGSVINATQISTTQISTIQINTTPTLALPVSSGLAATPPEVQANQAVNEPADRLPRPALLAGWSAREYQRGGASWYGPGFHGKRTASGERYDMNAMTAAHRTLPFGTWVRVKSLVNGREVEVRITDRGPFIHARVIDVSRSAAEALGMLGLGFKQVVLSVPLSTSDVVPHVQGQQVVRRRSLRR